MSTLSGFRFDISGASGSQGFLSPKSSHYCYILPRGGNAASASTGAKITFDSSDVASRFTAGDWIQAALSVANIRQVGAVGGNSITISGSNLTVAENDRIYLFGTTEPTITGSSATYTPNTVVYYRDDSAGDSYTNSMLTSNSDGLIQGWAASGIYDCLIQDGNRSNVGSIIDLSLGMVSGISVSDWAYFGSSVDITGALLVGGTLTVNKAMGVTGWATFGSTVTINAALGVTGTLAVGATTTLHGALGVTGTAIIGATTTVNGALGVTGWGTFGASVTITGALGVTGTAAFGTTVTMLIGPSNIVHADANATGTSTGGLQEAHDKLPATGGWIYVSGVSRCYYKATVISKPDVTIVGAGDSTILQAAGATDCICVAAHRCTLRDFKIDGVKATHSAGRGVRIVDTYNDTEVDNLTIVNTPDAGVAETTTHARTTVSNCRITDPGDAGSTEGFGIFFAATSTYFKALGNRIDAGTHAAIFCMAGSADGIITGNICHSGTDNGIRSGSIRTIIANNKCYGFGGASQDGFRIDMIDSVVEGNISYNNTGSGFKTDGCTSVSIIGNQAIGNANNGIYYTGGIGNASNLLISGNVCYGNTARGIGLLGASTTLTGIQIIGNRCLSNTYSGISIDTAGNTNGEVIDVFISDNYCKTNTLSGIYIAPVATGAHAWTNVVLRDNNLIGNVGFGIQVDTSGITGNICVEHNYYEGNSANSSISTTGWSACTT